MRRPDAKAAGNAAAWRSLRRNVHDILDYGGDWRFAGAAVNAFIVGLIIVNAAAFTAETVPALNDAYGEAFVLIDAVSVALFTVEYALRMWSSVEIPVFRGINPWRARLRYARQPLMLVDLAAILPFYLSFLLPIDLRILRVLRLFRFLKLARFSPALQALGRVLVNERRSLAGALLLMMTLLLFAATGMYFIERHDQPDAFGSVPAAAWWALATLTTIGYGDAVPVTALGKLFGGLIMLIGVGMFAVPIAILATGFSTEAARHQFVVTWSMVARVPLFADLDASVVSEVMALLHSRTVAPGTAIVTAGEEADAMYFIASGEAEVATDGEPILLGEGDFFGEMGLIHRRRRTNSVLARTKCRLLVLDRADFERLCHRRPEIRSHLRGIAEARAKPKSGKRKRG